jgi:hypothetical protein
MSGKVMTWEAAVQYLKFQPEQQERLVTVMLLSQLLV